MKKSTWMGFLAALALVFGITACDSPATKYCSVTYMTDYGTAPEKLEVEEGTILSATQLAAITADGYVFEGWYDGETKAEPDIFTVTKNVTLKAKWSVQQFTVTYKTDQGTTPAAVTLAVNTVLTAEQLSALTADGYTFGGWYDGETKAEAGTYKVTKDVTLTAKWEKVVVTPAAESTTPAQTTTTTTTTTNTSATVNYTITFDSKGGTAVDSITVSSGNKAAAPTAPTKTATASTSYTFAGWFTSTDNGTTLSDTAFDFVNTTITAPLTLYAKWNETALTNVPEGFVLVEGSTVTGGTKFALSGYSDDYYNDYYKGVFREGRTVTISNFYMCDHEVTQAEFLAVMGTNPSSFNSSPASGEEQTNRPVENVNWYMAIAYCNKKSVAEGLTPCYAVTGITDWANLAYSSIPTSNDATWNAVICNFNENGYRLPTEAEWEYAALGGKNGVTAGNPTDYAGTDSSSDLGTYAWYTSNSDDKTHEVKKKSPNALNLFDMSGNVFEWCWDWYDDNNTPSITSETPCTGVTSGSGRVSRGGCYSNYAYGCSVTHRNSLNPYYGSSFLGFRVVRSAQ